MPDILLVDDDAAFRKVYGRLLRRAGFEVHEAHDRPSAIAQFEARAYSAILLDLMLPPDGSAQAGMEMLAQFLGQKPNVKIVVISGAGDQRFMVQAVRHGAYDFITKPADPDVVQVVVERAVARCALEQKLERLKLELEAKAPRDAMLGQAPTFLAAKTMALQVASSDLPVLVTGENGTGKELIARLIHENSARAARPLVTVNCGALPESLLESTLFGHKKGAFTGATKDRPGLFKEANGGTLFLDEIGEMTPSLQVKLLRAIEYGHILPVGADHPVEVDVRILSATNRDLVHMQGTGDFREDLYWRINGVEVALPALRERQDDILLLATHFLNQSASIALHGASKTLATDAVEALLHHSWPGNLRELRHAMQRATVLSGARTELHAGDFAFGAPHQATSSPQPTAHTLAQKVEALERREIVAALAAHQNNRSKTAQLLGLSRQGLLNKIERYGIVAD